MKVIQSQCRDSTFVLACQFPTGPFGNSTSRVLLLQMALDPALTPSDLEQFAKGWRDMPKPMGIDDQIIVVDK